MVKTCLSLPATVTQILSLQKACVFRNFLKIPKTHLEDAICYLKQASEIMWMLRNIIHQLKIVLSADAELG